MPGFYRSLMALSFPRTAMLLALLTLGACATTGRPISTWMPAEGSTNPTLMFGMPESDNVVFRLECSASGTRLATFVAGVPRAVTAQTESFSTRLRLFLGRTEYDLGATGTALADGNSMVEAQLPDPDAFFAALMRQGRLVAITFAGRTKAPAPASEMVAAFRTGCASRGENRSSSRY